MIIYTTLSVITQHSHILWPLHRNPIETESYQFEVIIHALPLQNFCSLQFAVVFWMGYNRPFTFFGEQITVLFWTGYTNIHTTAVDADAVNRLTASSDFRRRV